MMSDLLVLFIPKHIEAQKISCPNLDKGNFIEATTDQTNWLNEKYNIDFLRL